MNAVAIIAAMRLSDAMQWALVTDEPLLQSKSTIAALVRRGLAEWTSGPRLQGDRVTVRGTLVDAWALTEPGERARADLLASIAAANARRPGAA